MTITSKTARKRKFPVDRESYYRMVIQMIKSPETTTEKLFDTCARYSKAAAEDGQNKPIWQPEKDSLERFRTIRPRTWEFDGEFVRLDPWLNLLLRMYADDRPDFGGPQSVLLRRVIQPAHAEWSPWYHFIWGSYFTGRITSAPLPKKEKTIVIRASDENFLNTWLTGNHRDIRCAGSLMEGIIGRKTSSPPIGEIPPGDDVAPKWWNILNAKTAHLYKKD